LPTDEESKIHPSSVYGITKQVQEQLIMTVCPTIGIEAVGMRYQNVYGPGQSLSNPYTGILSIFSNLILSGQDLNIFEDGLESRDFVYIDDVVDATILGIERDEAVNEVFNVGFGKPTDVLSIAKILIENYGKKTSINVSGNYRIGDIRHNYADLTKIQSKLGFKPKFDFQTGSAQFCKWVLSQKLPETKYQESLDEMRSKGLFK
jgi:dTDP-L-rhamnose 4-epimerase